MNGRYRRQPGANRPLVLDAAAVSAVGALAGRDRLAGVSQALWVSWVWGA